MQNVARRERRQRHRRMHNILGQKAWAGASDFFKFHAKSCILARFGQKTCFSRDYIGSHKCSRDLALSSAVWAYPAAPLSTGVHLQSVHFEAMHYMYISVHVVVVIGWNCIVCDVNICNSVHVFDQLVFIFAPVCIFVTCRADIGSLKMTLDQFDHSTIDSPGLWEMSRRFITQFNVTCIQLFFFRQYNECWL